MSMYNLIEHSDNYSKKSGILWQYCRGEPAINVVNGNVVDFNASNATTNSFKIKKKKRSNRLMAQKNVVITIPLKYLSKFGRTLERP